MNVDTLKALHECYSKLTNSSPKFHTFEHSWFDWHQAGYTQEDLILVLQYLQRENKRRSPERRFSLKLGMMINDHQRFDDLLQDALRIERSRVKPKSNRENILQAFRGSAEKEAQPLAQSVKDILRKAIE